MALGGWRAGQRSLQRFARDIGEEYETLREYRRVTDAYPTSARRLADLPYAHFHAVAAQPDRLELLARAEAEGLSVADLRSLIASRRRFRTPELPAGTFATIVADRDSEADRLLARLAALEGAPAAYRPPPQTRHRWTAN